MDINQKRSSGSFSVCMPTHNSNGWVRWSKYYDLDNINSTIERLERENKVNKDLSEM